MKKLTLDNWAIFSGLKLEGVVSGHPRFPEGHRIITSRLVALDGAQARTRSGSCYTLIGHSPDALEGLAVVFKAWGEPRGNPLDWSEDEAHS